MCSKYQASALTAMCKSALKALRARLCLPPEGPFTPGWELVFSGPPLKHQSFHRWDETAISEMQQRRRLWSMSAHQARWYSFSQDPRSGIALHDVLTCMLLLSCHRTAQEGCTRESSSMKQAGELPLASVFTPIAQGGHS